MKLACTKKLLDYLGIKAEKMQDEVDPFFGWSANLTIINRRKTLVVAHTASRCGFVLHGLKLKDLRRLPELILDDVRRMLESEYVRPEIIEQYLEELGQEVAFFANTSRKAIANCNKVCERVKFFADLLDPDTLFQKDILLWLNSEVLPNAKYCYAHEVLIGLLQERYGENIVSCRALELEVSLDLHTPCKRRIVVPDNFTFDVLHQVLQKCFAWEDCHLHHFIIETDAGGFLTKIIQPAWDEVENIPDVETLYSEKVTLKEVFSEKKEIFYEYDFGDEWLHTIRLRNVIEDCPMPYPRCILAEGDPPMEDCGGPWGYAHIMEVLKDKNHPEYHEIAMWAGDLSRYKLDMREINYAIRYVHRSGNVVW